MTAHSDVVSEVLDAGPAQALAGLLGGQEPDLSAGLPPLWHWVYLLDRPAQADLGPDGHPVRGSVQAPPAAGLRRMWAGGRVRCAGPLLLDAVATRTSGIAREQTKQGRSGPLLLRTVLHRVEQAGRVVVEEEQDVVYLQPDGSGPRPTSDGSLQPPGGWRVDITPTLLFRYSALTYNAHRIHYDRDYARDVEGYPGLLVHGPLQALLMAEAARRCTERTGAARFAYRLVSPLFDGQGCVAAVEPDGDALRTSIRDDSGRVTATGTLVGV